MELKLVEWFDDHFYKIQYDNEIGVEVTEYLPSVTTKLGALNKPFLTKWVGDLGARESNLRKLEASERGVRIHYAWHTYSTGGVVLYNPYSHPNYSSEELSAIEETYQGNVTIIHNQNEMYDVYKLQRWTETVNPTFLKSEFTVCSLVHRCAGTADNKVYIKEGEYAVSGNKLLKIPEGKYIADLKSGNSLSEEAKMQVATYVVCDEEATGEKLQGALLIHTGSRNKSGIEGLATVMVDRALCDKYFKKYLNVAKVWDDNFGSLKPKVREIPTIITLNKEG